MSNDKSQAREVHWEKTRSLTIIVLVIWFVFSFLVHWFARGLNELSFLGFPLGYYFAVQGSLIVFVVLIFVQNWRQDKIDDETGIYNKGEGESS
ncbi:MAG: DUF4212 domain-containing protein [Pseudomonadota bacterium]